jgi:hypothetical protein
VIDQSQGRGLASDAAPEVLTEIHQFVRLGNGALSGRFDSGEEEVKPPGPVTVRSNALEQVIVGLAIRFEEL